MWLAVLSVPTESQEQQTLFQWAQLQKGKYPELGLLFAVPNGEYRHKATAGRLKAQGVKAGVPDICLPVARGNFHGLFIELKRQKGGFLAPSQKAWLDALNQYGYHAVVCNGWGDASDTIMQYLRLREELE